MTCLETRARQFAIAAHGDQRYGERPYVDHLSEVARLLKEFGFPEEYVTAGWLHDVVEDTSKTASDIEAEFGSTVAALVSAVSGGGERGQHVAAIYEKITDNTDAVVVKLADRIANVEACLAGDRHSSRYAREHSGFERVIKDHVPALMWKRYLLALNAKKDAGR